MMAFFMPCSKKALAKVVAWRCALATQRGWVHLWVVLLLLPLPLWAQTTLTTPDISVARQNDQLTLSSNLSLELSPAVEDALKKGIAIYFVAEADLAKDRWYWTDKKISSKVRHYRLVYQPLTRKWRVNVSTSHDNLLESGMSLPQNFERLADAVAFIGRIVEWGVADWADLETDGRYTLSFRFRLDTTALPKPLQLGLIGQSDWTIAAGKTLRVVPDQIKPSDNR